MICSKYKLKEIIYIALKFLLYITFNKYDNLISYRFSSYLFSDNFLIYS